MRRPRLLLALCVVQAVSCLTCARPNRADANDAKSNGSVLRNPDTSVGDFGSSGLKRDFRQSHVDDPKPVRGYLLPLRNTSVDRELRHPGNSIEDLEWTTEGTRVIDDRLPAKNSFSKLLHQETIPRAFRFDTDDKRIENGDSAYSSNKDKAPSTKSELMQKDLQRK